ncbi:AfsR/SARP family transcriptional regulator [Micromonospora sp. WMMD961]|uniref:AfsR/SARP family transcriptional regulator n=1 Tax=Micromonospora sp. WMMD961 TaxID=3016100 RepID=UPI0024179F2F|nr:AfsR/SARP family transcriptional regulator [Micromonospora sp. WMMD961]MDG4784193.1 AfsR/SARP family transcriptional regulator [Micromonospora sp. WMMD961]
MRFRLLGPLTVEGAEDPLRLDGRRPRAVLAFLLLEAGALLRVEQIVDAVWGDAPPRTVRTQVHAQISVARRWLRALPDVRIVTHATGYALQVAPSDVDVSVFRQLVRQGRTLAGTGQPAEAAEAYRSALGLHRGEPLVDIEAPFAAAAAARLADERLGALAELIGLDLAAGRHHDLIPALSALVERHPWHEPLWCHLLVALNRAGRRGEAIRCYQRARRLFRDELGVEPGSELTLAYRSLLTGGPAAELSGEMARTLNRLSEAERILGEVRQQLSRLGLDGWAARPNPVAPPVPPRSSDGGATDAEIAA